MTNTSSNTVDDTRQAVARLLRAANGGSDPGRIVLQLVAPGEQAAAIFDDDRRDRLVVTTGDDGRLSAAIGIATHWTVLWHRDYRFARTPSGELVLLGKYGGLPVHAWIEDGRFFLDRGSPLLSALAEQAAMARFDTELAAFVGGAR